MDQEDRLLETTKKRHKKAHLAFTTKFQDITRNVTFGEKNNIVHGVKRASQQ